MTPVIRPLRAEDEPAWRRLWQGYLTFYESDLPEDVTATIFARLIGDSHYLARIAEIDGLAAGFVHCVFHPSTWAIADYCYLEDLFVAPSARGSGAGRALIETVYDEADKRGAAKVYWLTHQDNAPARHLYDKVATLSGFVHYRR